jgi:hypothetical protein
MDGVLHGAALADENGTAEVNFFLPFTEAGTAEVIVTGQNREPYFGTVQVEAAQGVYVLLQSFEIDDSNGNNDGKADAGENILLNVTLFNFGNTASGDLTATLSTADTNIVLENSTNTWPPLDPGASETKNNAFSFDVGEFFVNGHIAAFNLEITDGSATWNSEFSITLHSLITELPDLEKTEPISDISIYPNPFRNSFRVDYSLGVSSTVTINVIDMLGNQVLMVSSKDRQAAGEHSMPVDAGNLQPGIYLCKIQVAGRTIIKRIVLTK